MRQTSSSKVTLTDEQKETLKGILSNYEASDASHETMVSIFETMKEAEIPMSEDTQAMLEAEGFGSPEMTETAPPPPPQGGTGQESLESLDEDTQTELVSLIEQLLNGEITQKEFDESTGKLVDDSVGNLLSDYA